MASRPKDDSAGIGRTMDCICWDYHVPKKEPRFFLNPMSSFFGNFPWEGKGAPFPTPPPPEHRVTNRDDEQPKNKKG